MMASTFPPQGGMPQHPGMPHGQPMPGGVPHQQSMGGQMQMHPGVSGPHGQQVSQSPMMGMQPGMQMPGGPSAHAMSHLAPNGGQMMHQQGMPPQGMNPHVMNLNQQQQRMLWQRQQMARQAQMGMHPQGQPGGFNQQQIAAMQASGQMASLPPHLQQQMVNTQLMHQQHNAMQEAARHQQHQNNIAAQQQAHHIAMQHAASQGSNQGQHPSSQPQPNQTSMRPATTLAGTTGIEARPSPAPTAGPQGGPQPGPQTSQPPSQPNQQPQTSGPQGQPGQSAPSQPQTSQAQNNAAQQAAQGQGQNQGQNRVAGQQAMNNAQITQAAAIQRQQAIAAQAQRGSGQTLLQAFNFANKLGSFRADQQPNDLAYWQNFVDAHFTDDAIYRLVLRYSTDGATKQFDIHASGLARFLYTQFETDINQVQLVLDGNEEKKLGATHAVVRADRSRMLHWLRDGTQLVWNGALTLIYNSDKIEFLGFETREHQTYLPRSKLEELCAQAARESPNQNRSPKLTKTQQKKQRDLNREQSGLGTQDGVFDMRRLPPTPVTHFGIHKRLQAHLELGETMNHMQPLIFFSRERPELSVTQALNSLVESYQNQPPQPQQQTMSNANGIPIQGAFPPGGIQGAVRPPGMMQSPALSNAGLPQNGATPSPHQSNMAPPMAVSLSQTSHGQGSSSNTSPNVGGGKRRRSTVKGDDDGGGGVNGATGGGKVKASPRQGGGVGGGKRMKAS